MEEGVRSGRHPGTVLKSRNSSGCLIVRKKGDGVSGAGPSGPQKVFESKKEKKRPRLIMSDSGSSDDLLLDHYHRRVGPGGHQARNGGSIGFDRHGLEAAENGGKRNRIEHVKCKNAVGGNYELEVERKGSRLDVFEFDEYDGNDIGNAYLSGGETGVGGGGRFWGSKNVARTGSRQGYEQGFSGHIPADKRRHNFFDSSGSLSTERYGDADYFNKNRFKMKRDGAPFAKSLLRDKFGVATDEPIRLQGKNGVLKVMVNKKNKMAGSMKSYGRHKIVGNAVKGNSLVCPPAYSDMKNRQKSSSVSRSDKSRSIVPKAVQVKKNDTSEGDSGDSDTSLKMRVKKVKSSSSIKRVKTEEATPASERLSPTRCKEGKVKRGSGTEKQILREQIRKMLISAGWTIDYRPRRNRDYLDAVYINPTGTAYWSIIKAYDALQKQLEEDDNNSKLIGECSQFSPISEEVLSKLTRQTRKKMEKEMKKKQSDDAFNVKEASGRNSATSKHSMDDNDSSDHEEKLSSFIRQNGKSLKGRSREVEYGDGGNSPISAARKQGRAFTSNSRLVVGRRSRKIGRCTLLVRSSNKGQNSESDGFVPYAGKRTLLSWMIDSGTVQLSEKVQYMNRRRSRAILEGWITRDGIHCGCCSKILTVSKFEIHAGSKLRQPFQNIFLESGISLLQCQLEAWNKQEESACSGFHYVDIEGDDPNDDTCGLCADGGDLICCDGCPSTFHLSCLHIQMLPPGDWHCSNCSCKFCGVNDENFSQGDDIVGPLLKCSLCEKKYHRFCVSRTGDQPVASCTLSTTFCGQKCQELYERLQKFLGAKHELEAGFSWSLIRRTDPDIDTSIRGFPQRVECNSKLAVALSIMDECFLPIVDRRSGINLIHNVLYNCGSNFSRLDYSGFYTAIMEKGDEIICAASIRIHGTQLAEMPFIGTRHIYRRQGMCRRLFGAIESALSSLKVEKLIIPAISDLMHTWTTVFGFNPLEDSHKQELRSLNMLVFPDVDMLQKRLGNENLMETKLNVAADTETGPDVTTKSDIESAMNCDPYTHNDGELNNKVAAADVGISTHPSNDESMMSSPDGPIESMVQACKEGNVSSSSPSAEKVAPSASGNKVLSSFVIGDNVLEMEEFVSGSNVEGSPINCDARDATEENDEAACMETVPGENSVETYLTEVPASTIQRVGKGVAELGRKSQNVDSASASYSADGCMVQVSSNMHNQNTFEMEKVSEGTVCFSSLTAEKLADSASNKKSLTSFGVPNNVLEMENPVSESNANGTFRTPVNQKVRDDTDGNIEGTCIGSDSATGENFAEDNVDNNSEEMIRTITPACSVHTSDKNAGTIRDRNYSTVSTCKTNETTTHFNSNVDYRNLLKMERGSSGDVCFSSHSAEFASTDKVVSSFRTDDNVIETGKPMLDSNTKGISQAPANLEAGDTPEAIVGAVNSEPPSGCHGEICAEDADPDVYVEETSQTIYTEDKTDKSRVEVTKTNPNVVADSTSRCVDGSRLECSFSPYKKELESECGGVSQAAADAMNCEENVLHVCAAGSGTDACEVKIESASA